MIRNTITVPHSISDRWQNPCGSYCSADVLVQISEFIAGNLDTIKVLDAAISAATTTMDTEAASILLYDEEQGDLVFHSVQGHRAKDLKNIRLPKDELSIGGWTALHRQPLLISDAYSDARFNPAFDKSSGFITRSILSVPMIAKDRLFGVFQILNPRSKAHFSEEDLPMAAAVGRLVAVALLNAQEHKARLHAERLASIGQAIAGMVHCIKNILNGINAGSYLLDSQINENTSEEFIQGWHLVKNNLRLLTQTVLDMLAYSKDRQPAVHSCKLDDICDDVINIMQEQATEHRINLSLKQDTEAPIVALLDEAAIRRCLINLVGNALDACLDRQEGRVILRIGRQLNGGIYLSVTDNGHGIPSYLKQKLFTPFFSTKGNRGTGLGLAVTQKLMHEHGGHVTVLSEPGFGTTFSLEFPASVLPQPK